MAYADKRSRVLGCGLLLFGAAAILALLFGWLAAGPYTSTLPRTFDSEGWKAADGDTRCAMIADLQYRVGIVGKSRTELYRLLGAPQDEDDRDLTLDHWHLCPSFMDIYLLDVRRRGDRVASAWVRDT